MIWDGAVATLKQFDDPQAREVSDAIAAVQADPGNSDGSL